MQVNGLVERLDERGHQVALLRHLRLGLGDGPDLQQYRIRLLRVGQERRLIGRRDPQRYVCTEQVPDLARGRFRQVSGTQIRCLDRIRFLEHEATARVEAIGCHAHGDGKQERQQGKDRADKDARGSLLHAGRSRLVPVTDLEADLVGDEGDNREDREDQEDRHVLEGIGCGGHRCATS